MTTELGGLYMKSYIYMSACHMTLNPERYLILLLQLQYKKSWTKWNEFLLLYMHTSFVEVEAVILGKYLFHTTILCNL